MRVIRGRNVNDIYVVGRKLLDEEGVTENTRAGIALVMPCPVMSVYTRPQERVLFDDGRDANPFFHVMEGLWMLSGSDDGRWLDRYVSDFSSRYGEEGGIIHGAYGRRWRDFFIRDDRDSEDGFRVIDQLTTVVELLRKNPRDRQAVIGMWDPGVDLAVNVKDRPCNTHIYLRVREDLEFGRRQVLDLTVMCRSNDLIWGAHGANAVHMSMLMEYLAARIGVAMGVMYQMSHNYHGYADVLNKHPTPSKIDDPYFRGAVMPYSMFEDPDAIDKDVQNFCTGDRYMVTYRNSWFHHTAVPISLSHDAWKEKRYGEALEIIGRVNASDWQKACREWLERRARTRK